MCIYAHIYLFHAQHARNNHILYGYIARFIYLAQATCHHPLLQLLLWVSPFPGGPSPCAALCLMSRWAGRQSRKNALLPAESEPPKLVEDLLLGNFLDHYASPLFLKFQTTPLVYGFQVYAPPPCRGTGAPIKTNRPTQPHHPREPDPIIPFTRARDRL